MENINNILPEDDQERTYQLECLHHENETDLKNGREIIFKINE